MESYVKLRNSLAGKSHSKQSGGSETPSSQKTIAPAAPIGLSLSAVNDCISGCFDLFDQRFELLSSNILDHFTELATTMSARMSNPLFSAEPVVPFRKPVHGQDPSLSPPVSIGGCHRQFQGEGEDQVPRGSGYDQPSTSGKLLDRDVSVGPEAAQSQTPLFGGPEPAQSRLFPRRAQVSFAASAGLSPLDLGEGGDDRDSVMSDSLVMDKTFAHLFSFV